MSDARSAGGAMRSTRGIRGSFALRGGSKYRSAVAASAGEARVEGAVVFPFLEEVSRLHRREAFFVFVDRDLPDSVEVIGRGTRRSQEADRIGVAVPSFGIELARGELADGAEIFFADRAV